MAKPKLGARVIRAIFVSSTVGLFGFLGFYLLTTAINTIAGTTVVNPIGLGLIAFGGALTGGISIELSKDLEENG